MLYLNKLNFIIELYPNQFTKTYNFPPNKLHFAHRLAQVPINMHNLILLIVSWSDYSLHIKTSDRYFLGMMLCVFVCPMSNIFEIFLSGGRSIFCCLFTINYWRKVEIGAQKIWTLPFVLMQLYLPFSDIRFAYQILRNNPHVIAGKRKYDITMTTIGMSPQKK